MFVYSEKIFVFIKELQSFIKNVLSCEMGLKVLGDRFYDDLRNSSYPIKVVVYNNKNMLAYFDSSFYEMGFHETLIYAAKEQLYNIVRHELAHYMVFISHGTAVHPHGAEFKHFCLQKGWGEEVYRATICLEEGKDSLQMIESAILRKIKKLMALGASSNENEAKEAMIKSQQLLLKYNIDSKYVESEEEQVFLKRIMKQKKESAKMRAIAKIIETFFVSIVYRRAGEFTYLEILGSSINIEIAEYVATFLEYEMEKLWGIAQKVKSLKGMVAKNSFFIGIARGYCHQLQVMKSEYSSAVTDALMVIEKKLVEARSAIYRRLTTGKSNGNYCSESAAVGEQMGRRLQINPGISSSSSKGFREQLTHMP